MSLQARRELLAATAPNYQRANKCEKQQILDQFVAVTQYHRKYANRILLQYKESGSRPKRIKRQRDVIYGDAVRDALIVVWEAANQICSKRLVPFLPEMVVRLEKHGHLNIEPMCREKLLAISAATVDRLLFAYRHGGKKGLSLTKSGGLLKHQIPVRTFADWDEATKQPGFLEADLVAHCGTHPGGTFLCTLTLTDVLTGWTECFPLLFRDQQNVITALKQAAKRFPYPIKGLDTDNGTEFINYALAAYCEQNKITFTRSRPYKKNDQCFVEQKNGAIVRQFVGYDRFEGTKAYQHLDMIYEHLHLYVNLFQPSMRLIEKKRIKGRVKKTYDEAATPYQRTVKLISSDEQPQSQYGSLSMLKTVYETTDPIALLTQIRHELDALWGYAHLKQPLSPFALIEEKSKKQPAATIDAHPINQSSCDNSELEACDRPQSGNDLSPPTLSLPERRPYRQSKPRHGNCDVVRYWRTRQDPFADVWDEIAATLKREPTTTAKELLCLLQKRYPNQFTGGQLRTLQRRVREWRTTYIEQMKEQSLSNNADADCSEANNGLIRDTCKKLS